ncbi:glycine-rich domain-containing protein [Streptomyces goshikiensis]|uniref:glycine-rich domain-containing protein n=1 Tax=Streptomyces goshikiensis TaxID=1942 RepID=UPI0036B9A39D
MAALQLPSMLRDDKEGTPVTITQHDTTSALNLISPSLRTDLITMVREDYWPEITDDQGNRGVEELVAFLAVAATSTKKMAPSLRVDLFWHALILHTKPYAEFCNALAGGFIHHVPDRNGGHNPEEGRAAMRRTAEMIREAGYETDPDFWPINNATANCTQSYAGCSDSPVN